MGRLCVGLLGGLLILAPVFGCGSVDSSPDGGGADPNPSCDRLATQVACEARADCHAVFMDPMNCPCDAIGCCARFSACAAGTQARCNPPQTLCRAAAPYCESPAYVVAYTESCYEGCVRPEVCAP